MALFIQSSKSRYQNIFTISKSPHTSSISTRQLLFSLALAGITLSSASTANYKRDDTSAASGKRNSDLRSVTSNLPSPPPGPRLESWLLTTASGVTPSPPLETGAGAIKEIKSAYEKY
ncbi:hypothetical protein B0T21DRAFT_411823 [Apiosordaria backusii]|uniref:Uncharacterized protein n=1 Tax=Apiosordaria backusii TaxID=314023 RepID=A0AA40EFP4_9PEZI|nr:hypothetical protein B0T21DRAFT_411823 [Apiosordaria backusii]